jgi:exopolysaccharide biosynthesis polyprenyl glycosylphosphotransferase
MTTTVPNDGRIWGGPEAGDIPPFTRRAGVAARTEAYQKFMVDGGALLLAATPIYHPLDLSCFLISTIVVLYWLGLYQNRIAVSVLDDLPRLILAAGVGTALAFSVSSLIKGSTPYDDLMTDGTPLGRLLAQTAVLLVVGRVLCYAFIRTLRRRRAGSPTLIVGAGEVAGFLARVLTQRRDYGLAPVGFISEGPAAEEGLPVLDTPDHLDAVVRDHDIRHVIIAFDQGRDSDMAARLLGWTNQSCRILCVPRFYEVYPRAMAAGEVQGLPLVWVRRGRHQSVRRFVKRAIDLTVAALALLIALPVLAVCALSVRLEGRRVLFRQERIGRGGRRFTLLKISSMTPSSDREADTTWSIAGDSRVTPLGRFLRKSALDEVPQLYNVLRGDMSLVGPRPERPHFVEEFQERYHSYAHRHRVPVGLTGWAQVHGLRGDTPIADRVLLDNYYIENWSVWLDIKIALRTVTCLLRDLVG